MRWRWETAATESDIVISVSSSSSSSSSYSSSYSSSSSSSYSSTATSTTSSSSSNNSNSSGGGGSSSNGGGCGGGGRGYYSEVLLPQKEAGGAADVSMLDGAVHHMTQAIAGKVGGAVTETMDRAAGQLQARVSAVYDTAIQDAEARLEALRAVGAVLEKLIGARTQSALVIDEDILQLASGKLACRVCTENQGTLTHETMRKSPWISRPTERGERERGRRGERERERERERRKRGEKKGSRPSFPSLLSRAKFIFLVHSQLTEQKVFPVSRAVARSTGRGLLRRPGVSQIPFPALKKGNP